MNRWTILIRLILSRLTLLAHILKIKLKELLLPQMLAVDLKDTTQRLGPRGFFINKILTDLRKCKLGQ